MCMLDRDAYPLSRPHVGDLGRYQARMPVTTASPMPVTTGMAASVPSVSTMISCLVPSSMSTSNVSMTSHLQRRVTQEGSAVGPETSGQIDRSGGNQSVERKMEVAAFFGRSGQPAAGG